MAAMQKNTLKYSAVVFLGGASYGVMAATVKSAFADGFAWAQTAASQAFFGALLFAVALVVLAAFGKRPVPLAPSARPPCRPRLTPYVHLRAVQLRAHDAARVGGHHAAVPIHLDRHRLPGDRHPAQAARRRGRRAAVIILGGTLLASGLFSSTVGYLDPLGIACALLSAVSCATFMFLSARIGVDLPPIERGLVVCLGACILGFAVCPDYFASGALQAGIWTYGLILGVFGLFVPVVLFGIGTLHLSAGLSTIMASSELPCGIAISVLILSEPVDAFQVAGIVVIMLGVVVSQLSNSVPRASRHHSRRR